MRFQPVTCKNARRPHMSLFDDSEQGHCWKTRTSINQEHKGTGHINIWLCRRRNQGAMRVSEADPSSEDPSGGSWLIESCSTGAPFNGNPGVPRRDPERGHLSVIISAILDNRVLTSILGYFTINGHLHPIVCLNLTIPMWVSRCWSYFSYSDLFVNWVPVMWPAEWWTGIMIKTLQPSD